MYFIEPTITGMPHPQDSNRLGKRAFNPCSLLVGFLEGIGLLALASGLQRVELCFGGESDLPTCFTVGAARAPGTLGRRWPEIEPGSWVCPAAPSARTTGVSYALLDK